jgi:site-specific recombinase XerD
LLFEFHRKTGARRIGALNLRLGSLDPTKGSVWVTEKYAKTRELPLDVEFLGRLEAFARSRGAVRETDHVFRRKNNMRMTRKRFETIYKRHHKMTSWTQIDEVGVHWIRHTTLDDIRRTAGIEVAAAYAGHEPSSYGTIGIYTLVTFSEKQAAFERLFGPIFNNGSGQVEVPALLASVEDVGEKSTGGLCERAAES